MSNIPASAGLAWIREGFAIFRKQPGGLMLLMLAYLVAGVVLGIIPFLGQWLPMILAPVFTAVFVQACAAADRKQSLTPEMLRPIFQKPIFPRLAGLGALFVLVLPCWPCCLHPWLAWTPCASWPSSRRSRMLQQRQRRPMATSAGPCS